MHAFEFLNFLRQRVDLVRGARKLVTQVVNRLSRRLQVLFKLLRACGLVVEAFAQIGGQPLERLDVRFANRVALARRLRKAVRQRVAQILQLPVAARPSLGGLAAKPADLAQQGFAFGVQLREPPHIRPVRRANEMGQHVDIAESRAEQILAGERMRADRPVGAFDGAVLERLRPGGSQIFLARRFLEALDRCRVLLVEASC